MKIEYLNEFIKHYNQCLVNIINIIIFSKIIQTWHISREVLKKYLYNNILQHFIKSNLIFFQLSNGRFQGYFKNILGI
jgi:hypothetical protein